MQDEVRKIRHDLSGVASALYLLRDTMGEDCSLPTTMRGLAVMSADRLEDLMDKIDELLARQNHSL